MSPRPSLMLMAAAPVLAWTAACGEPDIDQTRQAVVEEGERATVSASLTYRERIALGVDAVAEARLLAIPADGGEPVQIAVQTQPLLGQQPPVAIEIVYDPSDIPDGATLALAGRIEDGAGRMRWSTPEPAAIGADGQAGELQLVRRALPMDAAETSGAELYQCETFQMEVVYDDPQLILTLDGNTYRLDPVQAASGARFAYGQGVSRVEFWSRGEEAMFRIGEDEEYIDCARQAADAGLGGIDEAETYVALGQEPGWRLTLSGNAARLMADYGERVIETEIAAYEPGPDGDIVRAGEGEDAFTVEIAAELCRDIATGMAYPDTVSLMLGEQRYDGCGGDPESLLTGGEWIVQSIGGETVDASPAPAIVFEGNGRMTGRGPCNTFNGGYEIAGEGIDFTGVASTRRACADERLNAVENTFFTALEGLAQYTLGDDGALAIDAGATRIVAARQ